MKNQMIIIVLDTPIDLDAIFAIEINISQDN